MSGTNPRREAVLGGPAIILIEPQLGENIGTCARAMLNCGLTDLRLVRPRDGWPNGSATASASGADLVLDNAKLFDTTEEAIADLAHVFATTARNRGMIKRIMTPKEAAVEMRAQSVAGLTTGILFGPERTGLFNDDLALADTSLTVPLNPAFSSLNLAQAVLLIGYEWYQTADATPGRYLHTGATRPATKDELVNLFGHLEAELDQCGFFSSPEKKPSMIRAIRNCFQRMDLTEQEVRTFHGIVSGLVGRRKPTPKE